MSIKKKERVTNIIKVGEKLGDKLAAQYEKKGDLKVLDAALDSYKLAVSASKAQLIYKKLTGNPGKIAFFEDEED